MRGPYRGVFHGSVMPLAGSAAGEQREPMREDADSPVSKNGAMLRPGANEMRYRGARIGKGSPAPIRRLWPAPLAKWRGEGILPSMEVAQ